jgi:outer membrane lipoprotein-sorting protein
MAMLFLFGSGWFSSRANELEKTLDEWFERQSQITTWSARFTQTRQLQALTQPLISHGRVWFAAPNLFRWELGEPPQTIAVREPDRMLVLYPRLKRAEIYPLEAAAGGPWREALALLEAGFPSNRSELEKKFEILSVQKTNDLVEVILQPRSAEARKMMPRFTLWFSASELALRSTALFFADGSVLQNDFIEPEVNSPLDRKLFRIELGPEYKIVEPLR